jgi:hypothetical protein
MPNAQNSWSPLLLKAAPGARWNGEDDRGFEVEDAVCNDGRKYELKFDAEFVFRGKKADD